MLLRGNEKKAEESEITLLVVEHFARLLYEKVLTIVVVVICRHKVER